MIILVIFPNTFYFFKNNWSQYLIKTRQFMLPKLKKNIYIHWFTLGIFNGLLPCGLVYVAAIGATIMGTFWEGALYMGLFGLGTLPITLLLSAHQTWLTPKLKIRFLKFVPILLFIAGVLLILRGLNLGIPYVSPIVENGTIHCVNCE
jgi:sulfite exporter TauE/SafE